MKDSYTEKLRTLRQRKLATKSQKIKYDFKGVGGKLNSPELKRDLHKVIFMLDLNEQTNKYYNFLTDLHIHCKVSKNYYLSHLASFRIKSLIKLSKSRGNFADIGFHF